jgi:hypothetical protein
VADDGFLPFEPRQHRMANAQQEWPSIATGIATGEEGTASELDGDHAVAAGSGEVAGAFAGKAASPGITSAQASALDDAPIETSADRQTSPEPEMQNPQLSTAAATSPCDHALVIRHEAIRLASIACGRALRHTVVLHPQTIAGFVDDAIVAAGNPRHARIRLHPLVADSQHGVDHERIWDAGLEPGDVIVECEGVTLRADLQGRAALLVRAAAER